jgi:hypothetical protein
LGWFPGEALSELQNGKAREISPGLSLEAGKEDPAMILLLIKLRSYFFGPAYGADRLDSKVPALSVAWGRD